MLHRSGPDRGKEEFTECRLRIIHAVGYSQYFEGVVRVVDTFLGGCKCSRVIASALSIDAGKFLARAIVFASQGARRFRVEGGRCLGCSAHPVDPDTGDGHDDR